MALFALSEMRFKRTIVISASQYMRQKRGENHEKQRDAEAVARR
jgi:hypothetical protein